MLSEIVRLGYSASNNEPINSISYKFFSIKQRRIEPRPRRVHESAEFTHPVDHSAGYSALKEKIQLGEDLSPHLSKSLLDEGYKDMLLNDWGIHHFHLGTAIDNTGFAQRTGPLLFAWVSEDEFFCIKVLLHGSWSQQELIQIIYKNWPQLIAANCIKTKHSSAYFLSDEDISKYRKLRIQTFIEIEPNVVCGITGGGYSAAGTSLKAQTQSMKYEQLVLNLECQVRENIDIYARLIAKEEFVSGKPLSLNLCVDSDGFYLTEAASQAKLFLHPHNA